jgi:integrase
VPRVKSPSKRPERKRSRGEGTVYELKAQIGKPRSKKPWVAVTPAEWVTENGQRRRRRHYFYGRTQSEARELRDVHLRERGKPLPPTLEVEEPNSTTVAEFVQVFLDEWKRRPGRGGNPHSAATIEDYRKTLTGHVIPRLGKLKLAELTDEDVQRLYAALDGKVSPSMRKRVHVALRTMLNFALTYKVGTGAQRAPLIARSPLATIPRSELPAYKRPSIEPLTEKQIGAVLEAAKGHRIAEALLMVALDTGARQGELIALRWEDVDIPGRRIHIRRAASEVTGEITITEPKSGKGRAVAVSSATIAVLKRRRTVAAREGLAASELVFAAERGGYLYKSNLLRDVWGPIRRQAGVPKARFHDLRHTSATLLLKANIHPKVVQERLGHSSIVLTLDTYSAFIPTMQADAAQAMATTLRRLLSKKPKGKR